MFDFHMALIKHWKFMYTKFAFFVFIFCFLLCLYSYALTHTHVSNCRSISTLDPIDNNSATANYDFENLINQAEDEGEEDCEVPGELARLLQQEERAIQPHEESVEIVNLGIEEDIKEVKIGENMDLSVKQRLIQMLHDYVEIFAWSYEDMPGLDTDIVVHRLPTKEDFPPVKQKVRRMCPKMSEDQSRGYETI